MKGALTVVLFRLFTIGVFAEEKERLSVKEGDSVTLMSKFKLLTDDKIKWMFSEIQIAKISSDTSESFRERLQLDKQTGDLTISNIKATDAGEYKLKFSSPRGSPPDMTFTVTVVPDTEVKPVPVTVMKGDSVTLRADLTDIQGYGAIQWRFGEQTFPGSSLIITDITTQDTGLYEADITSSSSSRYIIHHIQSFTVTISDEVISVSVLKGDTVTLLTGLTEIYHEIVWKFGDHEVIALLNGTVIKYWSNIDLNPQTGDLTITIRNIQREGDYKVEINTRRMISHRKYRINIGDAAVKDVSAKNGESVNLQIDTKIQNYELIQWMFGDTIIAQMNKTDRQLFEDSNEIFRHRLKLDHPTRSLTIKDTRITDSGHYKWETKSSRYTISRTTYVSVVPDTHPGLSAAAVAGIVVGVLLVGVAVGFVLGRIAYKKCGQSHQSVNGGNHIYQSTEDPNNEGTA